MLAKEILFLILLPSRAQLCDKHSWGSEILSLGQSSYPLPPSFGPEKENISFKQICVILTITRSYAALRAADLDWIVGQGYSSGGYILEKKH